MRKRGTTRTETDVTKYYSPTLFDARKEEVTLREGISIDTFFGDRKRRKNNGTTKLRKRK